MSKPSNVKKPAAVAGAAPCSAKIEHIKENQHFAIFNVLVNHCGQTLTADNVDKIMAEILTSMHTGPMSWAFLPNSEIRQAGPETHDKQKQRNPALPASNG